MDQIKRANLIAGKFFFSVPNLRFLGLRFHGGIYPVREGAYFVTSERSTGPMDRVYAVRFAFDDGEIVDASKTRRFASDTEAHARARDLATDGLIPGR